MKSSEIIIYIIIVEIYHNFGSWRGSIFMFFLFPFSHIWFQLFGVFKISRLFQTLLAFLVGKTAKQVNWLFSMRLFVLRIWLAVPFAQFFVPRLIHARKQSLNIMGWLKCVLRKRDWRLLQILFNRLKSFYLSTK